MSMSVFNKLIRFVEKFDWVDESDSGGLNTTLSFSLIELYGVIGLGVYLPPRNIKIDNFKTVYFLI